MKKEYNGLPVVMLRALLHMTQKEFGERYMIPQSVVATWETTQKKPPVYTARLLARECVRDILQGIYSKADAYMLDKPLNLAADRVVYPGWGCWDGTTWRAAPDGTLGGALSDRRPGESVIYAEAVSEGRFFSNSVAQIYLDADGEPVVHGVLPPNLLDAIGDWLHDLEPTREINLLP